MYFEMMLINIVSFYFSIFLPLYKPLHPYSSKWKGDNSSVTSLCISPDGKMLLSAGRTIKLWDLETKEIYRVSNFVELDARIFLSLIGAIVYLVFPDRTSGNVTKFEETTGNFGISGSCCCDDTFNCGFNLLSVE